MGRKMRLIFASFFVFGVVMPSAYSADDYSDDYPTSAKVDYVLACMAANGETREMLDRCSCSIDKIAANLTYEEYVEADTVLQVQQSVGTRGIFFRESAWAKKITEKLSRAQALSTLNCF